MMNFTGHYTFSVDQRSKMMSGLQYCLRALRGDKYSCDRPRWQTCIQINCSFREPGGGENKYYPGVGVGCFVKNVMAW